MKELQQSADALLKAISPPVALNQHNCLSVHVSQAHFFEVFVMSWKTLHIRLEFLLTHWCTGKLPYRKPQQYEPPHCHLVIEQWRILCKKLLMLAYALQTLLSIYTHHSSFKCICTSHKNVYSSLY